MWLLSSKTELSSSERKPKRKVREKRWWENPVRTIRVSDSASIPPNIPVRRNFWPVK